MSCWTSTSDCHWATWLFPACSERTRNRRAGLARVCRTAFRIAALCAVSLVLSSEISRAEETDFSTYHRAAEYCRGDVPRPMALSPDKRILCFDGEIWPQIDHSLVNDLDQGGLFVARSMGGDGVTAIKIANILVKRHAVVVIYDYCLSACPFAFLVASEQTYVLRNALVAWHHTSDVHYCPVLVEARDKGLKRLEKTACPDAPSEYREREERIKQFTAWFYSSRIIDPDFEEPPESNFVRRRLRGMFEGTGTYPGDLLWTWNPRFHARALKTKITYERYPGSQDEVDIMASKLRVHRVIYDP